MDELYSKEEHKEKHDSFYNPILECEYCRIEVYRRTHRCFGNGSSTVAIETTKKGI